MTSKFARVCMCMCRLVTMLQEASSICEDTSVLRRLTFAATSLHKDTPRYWEIVTSFGFNSSSESVCSERVKLLLENTHFLDKNAFDTDRALLEELSRQDGFEGHPLGIVLISSKQCCGMCGGHLLVREDRPSFPTIYSEEMGTPIFASFAAITGKDVHSPSTMGIIKALNQPSYMMMIALIFLTSFLQT